MHKSGAIPGFEFGRAGWPRSMDIIIRLPDESGKRPTLLAINASAASLLRCKRNRIHLAELFQAGAASLLTFRTLECLGGQHTAHLLNVSDQSASAGDVSLR